MENLSHVVIVVIQVLKVLVIIFPFQITLMAKESMMSGHINRL